MACDRFIKTNKDIIETIQRKHSYKEQRRQPKIGLNQHRTGQKTSMNPLTGRCGDGACRRDHSNAQPAQSSTASFQEIVTMTLAAVQKSQSKGSGKGNDRGRSPGDSKPKFGFEPDCFECGANGQERPDCPKSKAVLSKNSGQRPKGHKGAFEKAREEHRQKYGNTSSRPRSSSRDSKGKGKKGRRKTPEPPRSHDCRTRNHPTTQIVNAKPWRSRV